MTAIAFPETYTRNRRGDGRAQCVVDGCLKQPHGHGLCSKHYEQARKLDALPVAIVPVLTCKVDGCDQETAPGSRCCVLHRERRKRTGSFGAVERLRRAPGSCYPTGQGYAIRTDRGHALARVQGKVLEHRRVLFDLIGPGPHPCHWCSVPVDWSYGLDPEDVLVVDHLDFDGLNNEPSNLVPSCHPCNSARTR